MICVLSYPLHSPKSLDTLDTYQIWLLLFLFTDCYNRKVRKVDGLKLSGEYGTLFDEVSAADGRNVEANLLQMAKLCAEKQDLDIQKAALQLTPHNKKKCCT